MKIFLVFYPHTNVKLVIFIYPIFSGNQRSASACVYPLWNCIGEILEKIEEEKNGWDKRGKKVSILEDDPTNISCTVFGAC